MDEDEVARWAVRLDSGEALAPALKAELDRWLALDERRHGALLRAQAVLAYLDRGRALGGEGADAESAGERARPDASDTPVRDLIGRRRLLIGAAATMVGSVGLAALWRASQWGQKIDTAVGEIRRLPLADGSVATVNTNSRLAVAMQPDRRIVRIEDGEAWFQVASDKARPFVVEAGEVRVQAIGTAFSVRRRDDGAEVLVTEGVVETWIVGKEEARERIGAGSKAVLAQADPRIEVAEAAHEIDQELAWRSGELVLKGHTLDYAVAEMNRYNARRIEIADPRLGSRELVGFFRTNEPEEFARAVSAMTGAHMVEDGDRIVLDSDAR
jgi:transmembrane sensor